jgi:hypothetical protein
MLSPVFVYFLGSLTDWPYRYSSVARCHPSNDNVHTDGHISVMSQCDFESTEVYQ